MSENVHPVTESSPTPSTSSNTKTAPSNTTTPSSNTKISSLAELRQKYPKFYELFVRGMAIQVITLAQQRNDRYIAELQRERAEEQRA